ncbi:helix-turn-helix domain-containing protein [Streptomyces venezuelae]|uniref:helix-turn-helix domain-containing protein n=1 Tax=Streptomyces venezuelae TaxID=54571 RepID=UPI00278BB4A4|nr:helix-turn-helix domain-containing protein [Streptomyces venezuelae]
MSEALRNAVGPSAVSPRDQEALANRLTVSDHGHLRVATLDADAHRIRCAAEPVKVRQGAGTDFVSIAVQVSGTSVLVRSGRGTRLEPADAAFLLPGHAFGLEFLDRGRLHLLRVPRGFLPLPDEHVHSGSADEAAQAVAPLLAGLAETLTRLQPGTGAWIAGSLAEALGTLVSLRASSRSAAASELMANVHAHIDGRLADPGLSPASIAAAHHISVRYVHRLFAQEGTTVGTWIRHRRLEESRRDLTRSGPSSPTIAAVAFRWGFVSASHFSRVFRQTYGITPHEWREVHARPVQGGRPPYPL